MTLHQWHRDDPLYNTWMGLMTRQNNGEIDVYGEWYDFRYFKSDIRDLLGERPTPDHVLARIDRNRDYEPDNVRWATRSELLQDTVKSRRITAFGLCLVLSEWGRRLHTLPTNISFQLKKGKSMEWIVEHYGGRAAVEAIREEVEELVTLRQPYDECDLPDYDDFEMGMFLNRRMTREPYDG